MEYVNLRELSPEEKTQAQLDNWFSYHPPGPGDAEKYERLRAAGGQLAAVICELCPNSADRTAAIRKVREAIYTANASIACGGQ